MHRLLASRHVDTAYGAAAITAGIVIVLCVLVGFSVLVSLIGEWVR